ncbi:MAG: choice-of-anchor Q domain-containing protein [Planctomycetota bacterium]
MRTRTKIIITFFVLLVLVISNTQESSFADEIPGNDIPMIQYHIDTGLVLLDPDGLALADARLDFRNSIVNSFFDNSPDNPLFAEYGGLIPNWESGFAGESIYGVSRIAEGYIGPMRAWAQISSGLDTQDFLGVRCHWVGGSAWDIVETNVTVVPLPATEPTTYYVDAIDGNDDNDGLSPETALATIQAAINAAYDGDTVIVAPGTYTGPGNRDIDFLGKAIIVQSSNPNDPNVVAATIIDCNGTEGEPHRGFIFHSDEDGNSVLAGLTITNGYANLGGGIYCYDASPSIRKCTIWHNTVAYSSGEYGHGAGIYCHSGSPQISNCIISHNSGDFIFGGGIFCEHSNLEISNSVISMNKAESGAGGGVYCSRSSMTVINCTINGNIADGMAGGITLYLSNATIADCIVSGNSSRYPGGGIVVHDSDCTIRNCIIRANSGTEGGGVNAYAWPPNDVTITNCLIIGNFGSINGGGLNVVSSGSISNCTIVGNYAPIGGGLYQCDALLKNCIIWGNSLEQIVDIYDTTKIKYSDIQGGWPGEGNIDADPCFIDMGDWDANGTPSKPFDDFWVDGDYHLLPTSPCIDAANDANVYTDIEGNPRPFDFPGVDNNGELPDFDMGAYEAVADQAELTLLPRTINRSSRQKRILAWLRLPEGITKDQIDRDTPLVLYPGGIEADRQYIFQNRRRRQGQTSIFAFFDKAELMDAVDDNGRVELQVLGHFVDPGRYFYGSDKVWIKHKQWRRWRRR